MIRTRRLGLGVAASIVAVGGSTSVAAQADYRPAYIYAQRCFAVDSVMKDEVSGHRAFDAAMKLGHLLNLSDQQLNDDFATWSASEMVKSARDPRYKEQLLSECRKLGLAD